MWFCSVKPWGDPPDVLCLWCHVPLPYHVPCAVMMWNLNKCCVLNGRCGSSLLCQPLHVLAWPSQLSSNSPVYLGQWGSSPLSQYPKVKFFLVVCCTCLQGIHIGAVWFCSWVLYSVFVNLFCASISWEVMSWYFWSVVMDKLSRACYLMLVMRSVLLAVGSVWCVCFLGRPVFCSQHIGGVVCPVFLWECENLGPYCICLGLTDQSSCGIGVMYCVLVFFLYSRGMCYGNLGCTAFWANVIYSVNIILRICHGGNISLSGKFCGVSYQCSFGVYCLKGGYAVFIWVLSECYISFIVLVGVLGSKWSLSLICVPRVWCIIFSASSLLGKVCWVIRVCGLKQ